LREGTDALPSVFNGSAFEEIMVGKEDLIYNKGVNTKEEPIALELIYQFGATVYHQ
jgi:hypothetical protein